MNTAQLYQSITPRYPELQGQVAVVTGSSQGIGKGIAIRLAREGMKVVVNSRTPETVRATTAELQNLGADVIGTPADMGTTEGVNTLFDDTLRAFGTVDLLVNNAAILARKHFFDVEESLLDAELAANVRGPYLCACRAAAAMKDKGGSIINISSIGGARAHWRGLPYDVTKGAIDAMTQAMALELAEYNIRVNGIAPGPITTERWALRDPDQVREVTDRVPLRRFGTPLDVAGLVAFLASNDAGYITGETIAVDGGVLAQLSPRGQPI
ncbi:MAG: glucose 1-dehydrogenase [Anaerolineae bacterium]|nr:glucose 1-dehydrogenase [Anaerolineae bacterium]